MHQISIMFPSWPSDLVREIEHYASLYDCKRETEIIKEHQYIRHLPIVMKGVIKVFSRFQEKEILLYFITPNQSCIMSFYAAMHQEPSKIFAVTEEDTQLLLLPIEQVNKWVKRFPEFNSLFYNQYNQRYTELIDTIGQLLINKMDIRLLHHLQKLSHINASPIIQMSHSELAHELGTSREVITRTLKRLESEGKIFYEKGIIKINTV